MFDVNHDASLVTAFHVRAFHVRAGASGRSERVWAHMTVVVMANHWSLEVVLEWTPTSFARSGARAR